MNEELQRTLIEAATPERYEKLTSELAHQIHERAAFRICEVPLCLSSDFSGRLESAGMDLIRQMATPEFHAYSEPTLPTGGAAPNESAHPSFVLLDFAVVRDEAGQWQPALIELQGFASLFGLAFDLDLAYREILPIPEGQTAYFNGRSRAQAIEHLRRTILADTDPEQVILLEVDPEHQKTHVDFRATEDLLGVHTVGIDRVRRRGRNLFYEREGREIPVRRIYNRCLWEEVERKGVRTEFTFADDLDVTWVAHPNWYHRISKHSMPFLKSPFVPDCRLLSQLDGIPEDLEQYVLKPLDEWGGEGVDLHPTKEDIEAVSRPESYILQSKIEYAPVFETPEGGSKAEIRLMYAWPDHDPEPALVTLLLRIFRSEFSNVGRNNMPWAGASIAYHPG